MACLTVTGTAAALAAVIPPAISEVPIASLKNGMDTSHIYIKGVVQTIWPFQRITPKRCLMKIVLAQDETAGSATVAVFFTGMYAEYCKDLQMPTQLCLSNFYVEHVTAPDATGATVQVIMDKTRSDASLWLCLGTPDATPSTSAGTSGAPAPRTSAAPVPRTSAVSIPRTSAAAYGTTRISIVTAPRTLVASGTANTSVVSVTTNTQPTAAQAVSPTKGRSYTYTSLVDLKEGMIANVYGVVKFSKPPARTRGTDFSCMVSLIDPSLENYPEMTKLKCLLFARDKEKLPHVSTLGDIIRIHRLKVTTFRGELQGGSGPGFSWLLFDGAVGGSLEPKTSFATYTITQEDKAKVESLRTWLSSSGGQLLDVDPVSRMQMFVDVPPAAYFNTVVQVVAVCVIEPGVTFLMRVWDGTKSPYPVYEVPTTDVSANVLSDPLLVAQASGYTYDVCAFDDHFHVASKVRPGDFVQFTNLHAMVHKPPAGNTTINGDDHDIVPTLELCLHRGTSYNRGMSIVQSTHCSLQQLKSRLQKVIDETPVQSVGSPVTPDGGEQVRVENNGLTEGVVEDRGLPLADSVANQNGGPPDVVPSTSNDGEESTQESSTCMQRTATVTSGYRHIKPTPISDMLNHEVPYKFRIKGRVQDFQPKPTAAHQLVHMQCPLCNFLSPVPHDVTAVENAGSEMSIQSSSITFSLPPGQQAGSIDAYTERDGLKRYLCPHCTSKSPRKTRRTQEPAAPPELQFVMMLRFLVEDGTGWCLLQLCKDEAEYFFHDQRAESLLKDWDAMEAVICELQRLCPQPGCSKKSPVMECFVKSFTTKSGVNYQIFKTLLSLDTSQY